MVIDKSGSIFDDRRKQDRRKSEGKTSVERRAGKDRRQEEQINRRKWKDISSEMKCLFACFNSYNID